MANEHSTLKALFTDTADAIRELTGGTEKIVADNFPETIRAYEPSMDDIHLRVTLNDDGTYSPSYEEIVTVCMSGDKRPFIVESGWSIMYGGLWNSGTTGDPWDQEVCAYPDIGFLLGNSNAGFSVWKLRPDGTWVYEEHVYNGLWINGHMGPEADPEHILKGYHALKYISPNEVEWVSGTIESVEATTITPSEEEQIAVEAGMYTAGDVKVGPIPDGYVLNPTLMDVAMVFTLDLETMTYSPGYAELAEAFNNMMEYKVVPLLMDSNGVPWLIAGMGPDNSFAFVQHMPSGDGDAETNGYYLKSDGTAEEFTQAKATYGALEYRIDVDSSTMTYTPSFETIYNDLGALMDVDMQEWPVIIALYVDGILFGQMDALNTTMLDGTPILLFSGGVSDDLTTSKTWILVPTGECAMFEYENLMYRSNVEAGNPYIYLDKSTGVVTASVNQSSGYIEEDSYKEKTMQLDVQEGVTITPTKSAQTAVAAGKFTTGDVRVAAATIDAVTQRVTLNADGTISPSFRELSGMNETDGFAWEDFANARFYIAQEDLVDVTESGSSGYQRLQLPYITNAGFNCTTNTTTDPGVPRGVFAANVMGNKIYLYTIKTDDTWSVKEVPIAYKSTIDDVSTKITLNSDGTYSPSFKELMGLEESSAATFENLATVNFYILRDEQIDNQYEDAQPEYISYSGFGYEDGSIGLYAMSVTVDIGEDGTEKISAMRLYTLTSDSTWTVRDIPFTYNSTVDDIATRVTLNSDGTISPSFRELCGAEETDVLAWENFASARFYIAKEDLTDVSESSGSSNYQKLQVPYILNSGFNCTDSDVGYSLYAANVVGGLIYLYIIKSDDTWTVKEIPFDAVVIDTLTNPATAADIPEGLEVLDGEGKLMTGTMPSKSFTDTDIDFSVVQADGRVVAKLTLERGYYPTGATIQQNHCLMTQAAKTVTPTTYNRTAVEAGRYTTGAVMVAGDANLLPENIKKGVTIFGVTGNYEGSGNSSSDYENGNEVYF